MTRLLLVEPSDVLRAMLVQMLEKNFCVTTCGDGDAALQLLRESRPDILVIDLELPGGGGLDILEQAGDTLPQIILALTGFTNSYVQQRAKDLGVTYMLRTPCRADTIAARVKDLVNWYSQPNLQLPDAQAITAAHLQRLGIPADRDGYNMLRVGIPMFAQDPGQRLGKELYAVICEILGSGTPQTVEHSIRIAIAAAYDTGSQRIWAEYFPPGANGTIPCPSNKAFIARLAEMLNET